MASDSTADPGSSRTPGALPAPPAFRHRFSGRDVAAGLSVTLLLIPQALAYAELAGVPPHIGLYAAAAAPLATAFFASSPYLQTGPTALTALLVLGALVPLASPATPEYVALAVLLALMVGVMRVGVGLLRAGDVAYLMSRPVLMGFTSGAAVLIVGSQLPGALGMSQVPGDRVLSRAWWALGHVSSWEAASVILTVVTVALIRGGRRVHSLFPGVLVATVGGLVWSRAAGYDGVTLGAVPTGLPTPSLDLPWTALPALLIPAAVIALVGFAEPASIARTYAAEDRQPWSPSREFFSQGMANLASGLAGAFPVGGSFARSGINRMAGATSRWSGAVTGLAVLAFLPFASVLAPLPRAVLSAIVIAAVASLVKVHELVRMWRHSRLQALVGFSTFGATIALSPRIDLAVLVGVILALGVHAWREMYPQLRSWTEGDTLHLQPEGVLWFGSAPEVEQAAFTLLARAGEVRRVEVHLGRLGRIDYTGALGLRDFREDARGAGVEVVFVDIPDHARRIMARVVDEPHDDPA